MLTPNHPLAYCKKHFLLHLKLLNFIQHNVSLHESYVAFNVTVLTILNGIAHNIITKHVINCCLDTHLGTALRSIPKHSMMDIEDILTLEEKRMATSMENAEDAFHSIFNQLYKN